MRGRRGTIDIGRRIYERGKVSIRLVFDADPLVLNL